MVSTNICISLPTSYLLALDKTRGRIPRSTYLQIILEEKLSKLGAIK